MGACSGRQRGTHFRRVDVFLEHRHPPADEPEDVNPVVRERAALDDGFPLGVPKDRNRVVTDDPVLLFERGVLDASLAVLQ